MVGCLQVNLLKNTKIPASRRVLKTKATEHRKHASRTENKLNGRREKRGHPKAATVVPVAGEIEVATRQAGEANIVEPRPAAQSEEIVIFLV